MHLKVKKDLRDAQIISMKELVQQQLAEEANDKILPISRWLAMYLFNEIPVDLDTFNKNNMLSGVIHDIINYSGSDNGNVYFTSFVIVKNEKTLYRLYISYLLEIKKWGFSFEYVDNNKCSLLYGSYNAELEEIINNFRGHIEFMIADIIEKIRSKKND